MKFGLRLIEYVGSPRQLVDLAVLAESVGFDSVWFPHDPFMRHTWVMMAAVAEHTDRIQIGTVGTNPYTTDPSEIASFIATLDDLSKGRSILGPMVSAV
jgi:5,10-methylenetetrahydromethanopterin reductase